MADREVLTLRHTEDDKLREHCEHRFKTMMPPSDLVGDWYDIAGLCMPQRSRQLVENHKGKQRSASTRANLYDGHAIRSFEICANGMLSGLSSRSRPWRKSILEDDALMEYHPVRVWLDAYDKLVDKALSASNFYEAMLSCYLEMAGFGTAAVFIDKTRTDSPKIACHALTVGEYGIAVDENGVANALTRTYSLSTLQMVEAFVADRADRRQLDWSRVTLPVKEAFDRGNYGHDFVVRQLAEPNPTYMPGRIGKIGMPFRSIKWEEGQQDKKKFLAIDGYRSQPFMAPRWETLSGNAWGTGRGKKALPDMRALQLQAKRKGEATDMAVKPPTWGPPSIDRVSMLPGSHTVVAAADMTQGIQPVYEIPYQVIGAINEDIRDARQAIDRATYADLFMAITNMEGVQPRNVEELVRRHEEQLTQLGPVTDRANGELLQPANDRVGEILAMRGELLNDLPPPPPEIEGMEIRTDFTSILAQAQRMMGISGTERSVAFVGNMAAIFPDAADNLDPDAIIKDYWERSGAPATGLRDEKVRDGIREQRAQAQAAERAAAQMPAVQQGADAARLLSEADTGTGNLLERLVR